jgi:hypothetical protein
MDSFSPPDLNLECVCVTSRDDPILAALVSSYFSEPNTYFTVLTFPNLEVPSAPKVNFQDDDYLSRFMGARAAVRINNAIAKLSPTLVIFAGLNDAQKSYPPRIF